MNAINTVAVIEAVCLDGIGSLGEARGEIDVREWIFIRRAGQRNFVKSPLFDADLRLIGVERQIGEQ